MTALRTRLDRLELANRPGTRGRFICVTAGQCTNAHVDAYLRQQGITVGASDLVLIETHADRGTARSIAPNDPMSHQILECTERFEDMLARLG